MGEKRMLLLLDTKAQNYGDNLLKHKIETQPLPIN